MEGLGQISENGLMQSRAEASGGQFSGEDTPMLKSVMEFEKREKHEMKNTCRSVGVVYIPILAHTY